MASNELTWCAIFLFMGFVFAQRCPAYICLQEEVKGNGTCMRKVVIKKDIDYEVRRCEHDKFCNFSNSEIDSHCANRSLVRSLYPGEYCTIHTECIYNLCGEQSQRCLGVPKTGYCDSEDICDPGLYCDMEINKCVDAKEEREECDAKEQCDVYYTCSLGKCVPIGSLKIGEEASSIEACKSYHILNGKCAEGEKFKRRGNETNNYIPIENEYCVYTINGKETNGSLMCGFTGKRNEKFCPLGTGDHFAKKTLEDVIPSFDPFL